MSVEQIDIEAFLELSKTALLLDVRSPAEFAKGHIPWATNLPLFTDEERKIVGTLYKQEGREKAILKGLDIVGPKMSSFLSETKSLIANNTICIHCWRGGMRSGSMAWLFAQMGYTVYVLQKGYKAYRHHILSFFEKPYTMEVVGGRTGSGKTAILHLLKSKGAQIIDLEAIAHHKGSAFGFINENNQPTQEQFENNLGHALMTIDENKTLWIEDESKNIGRCFMPHPFWIRLRHAPLWLLEIGTATRIKQLVKDYGDVDREILKGVFSGIEKRLGNEKMKEALVALEENDLETAAAIALYYYDKAYDHCLIKKQTKEIERVVVADGSLQTATHLLLNKVKNRITE